jgi:hypothetical protein
LLKLRAVFDKNFDKFEMYSLKNIFSIPTDLKLPEEEPAEVLEHADVDEGALDGELAQLHQKLADMRGAERALKENNRSLAVSLDHFKRGVESLDSSAQSFQTHNVSSPSRAIAHVVQQTRELEKLDESMAVAGEQLMKDVSLAGRDGAGAGGAGGAGGGRGQGRPSQPAKPFVPIDLGDAAAVAGAYNARRANLGGASTGQLQAMNAQMVPQKE